jgi:putative peptide zinc metalloprotease protein
MTESIFSPYWYRVRDMHLELRPQVNVVRQFYRDQLWFVLQDPVSGKHYRVDAPAYQFVGRLDGHHTVQEIWDALAVEHGEAAPTQSDVIRLLGELSEASLLRAEQSPEFAEMFRRRDERKIKRDKSFVNPLAFRVPLFDPSTVLNRLLRIGNGLMQPATLVVWTAIVLFGLAAAVINWRLISAYAHVHLLTPQYLFLMWLCYPVIKGLHELGHALATRVWGGEVKEMGITLLLLVPVPYVDASAASAFRERRQRVMVSVIGVMVELLIAACATILWLNIEDGVVRDLAFVAMFVGGVSTLLFNGNPLMRFDGYYALTDALELPNLAVRARAYVAYAAQRFLLGLRSLRSPAANGSERAWLLGYAAAAWCYRVALSLFIAVWVSAKSALLAWLVLGWFVIALFVKPALQIVKYLLTSSRLVKRRVKSVALAGAMFAAASAFVLFVPIPLSIKAEGVVWLPEQARVRAGTEGFVDEVLAADGQFVTRDQPLLRLSDPKLLTRREELGAQVHRLVVAHESAVAIDTARAQSLADEIAKVEAELEQTNARVAELVVRSGVDGTLVMPRAKDALSSYVGKGAILAHVLAPDSVTVRAALSQADIGLVRERTQKVAVRLAETFDEVLAAHIASDTPDATNELPSMALGDHGGGNWVTDPSDSKGLKTLEPFFLMDLQLSAKSVERVGGRAYALFDLGSEPLAARVLRASQRLLLHHFSAQG